MVNLPVNKYRKNDYWIGTTCKVQSNHWVNTDNHFAIQYISEINFWNTLENNNFKKELSEEKKKKSENTFTRWQDLRYFYFHVFSLFVVIPFSQKFRVSFRMEQNQEHLVGCWGNSRNKTQKKKTFSCPFVISFKSKRLLSMTKHTPLFVDLFSYLLRFRINGFTICADMMVWAVWVLPRLLLVFFSRIYFSCFKDVLRGLNIMC